MSGPNFIKCLLISSSSMYLGRPPKYTFLEEVATTEQEKLEKGDTGIEEVLEASPNGLGMHDPFRWTWLTPAVVSSCTSIR